MTRKREEILLSMHMQGKENTFGHPIGFVLPKESPCDDIRLGIPSSRISKSRDDDSIHMISKLKETQCKLGLVGVIYKMYISVFFTNSIFREDDPLRPK